VALQSGGDVELRDYLEVVRRRKWVIAVTVLVVVGVALVLSLLQTPVYQGNAQLLLQPRSAERLFDPETGQRDPGRTVQTEIQVLKSEPIRRAVRDELGTAPKVSAHPIGDTDVVEVSARSTNPERAAAIANAYARAYIEFRRDQSVQDDVSAAEEIQRKVSEIEVKIRALDDQLRAQLRDEVRSGLHSERDVLVEQRALFEQKLDELEIEQALSRGGAQIVTEASVPEQPAEPRPRRNAVLGALAGLLFGIGLAFLFEYLDDSIKSKDDLERIVPEVPTLGVVPLVTGWREREKAQLVSISDPSSAAAEAYRSLRTSIQFVGLDRALRTVQVTSANAGEGKTTTLANLAIALARANQRVVVVCCDLRRPRVHEFFRLDNRIGFTSVMLGEATPSEAIQSVPGDDRIKVLASGPAPPNPSELLATRRTAELFTSLKAQSDIVLVDSPPVLPVTDAAVLSTRVDATLLVATAGSTSKKELHRAHEVLRQVDAPIIGTVLNGVSPDSGYGYAYQYKYYAKQPPGPSRQRNGQRGPGREAVRRG
jgi:non-specific protein-tyrosine kinase